MYENFVPYFLTCDEAFTFSGKTGSYNPRMNTVHCHVGTHFLQTTQTKLFLNIYVCMYGFRVLIMKDDHQP